MQIATAYETQNDPRPIRIILELKLEFECVGNVEMMQVVADEVEELSNLAIIVMEIVNTSATKVQFLLLGKITTWYNLSNFLQ